MRLEMGESTIQFLPKTRTYSFKLQLKLVQLFIMRKIVQQMFHLHHIELFLRVQMAVHLHFPQLSGKRGDKPPIFKSYNALAVNSLSRELTALSISSRISSILS